MRKLYLLLFGVIFSITLSAQNCISLGCSNAYTVTTNGVQVDEGSGPEWGCYNTFPRKQTFWQYFYSPSGGNYTQSFSSAADLDWVVFDMGTSLPSIICPVSPTGWTQAGCDISFDPGGPTGPGVESAVPTTAGHYYAVALILWEPLTITFTFGTPQLGGSNLGAANCPGVLPIKLESFTAALQSDNKVLLKWLVSEEVNVSHYEVEFSTDGRNFGSIGNLGANNSRNYSLTHSISSADEIIYYRLKTVDLDGRVSYSNIIRIQTKGINKFSIMGNPITDNLNIAGLSSRGEIKIFDIAGKLLMKRNIQSQSLSMDVSFLNNGMYLLQYFDGNNSETKKFIKQ